MKLIKTNVDGLMKNPDSGVIINKNYAEYEMILQKRKHQAELDALKNKLESEIDQKIEEKLRKILDAKVSGT